MIAFMCFGDIVVNSYNILMHGAYKMCLHSVERKDAKLMMEELNILIIN